RFGIEGLVSFLLDTGASKTLLCPADSAKFKIDHTKLVNKTEATGFGGKGYMHREPAEIRFRGENNTIFSYDIDLGIAVPTVEIEEISSVLGRDIINRWKISCDKMHDKLCVHVIKSDHVYPLRTKR